MRHVQRRMLILVVLSVLLFLPSQALSLQAAPEPDGFFTVLQRNLLQSTGPQVAIDQNIVATAGGTVSIPVRFTSNGNSISSAVFSLDYDENWLAFDATDADSDGIPDAITFNLPGAFGGSVTFDAADSDGELDFFIADTFPPLASLVNGTLATVQLTVGSPVTDTVAPIRFAGDPAPSFGNTSGQSVAGTTQNGSVFIDIPDVVPTTIGISRIRPEQGLSTIPNEVQITGSNIPSTAIVLIGTTQLQSATWIDQSLLQVTIPIDLSPGSYDVTIRNTSTSEEVTLANGYTVVTTAGDDFTISADNLWTEPTTLRVGQNVLLGATFQRRGGKSTEQIQVSFYQGNPEQGGTLLGSTQSLPVPPGPNTQESVTLSWTTPATEGDMSLYVVIDADGDVVEISEANNTANRMVSILPEASDDLPPFVTGLQVNNGAPETNTVSVTIQLDANDSGGGQVTSMLLTEREFSASASAWVPRQSTDWIPYQASYPLTLGSRGGVRYIQAWVADNVGNISEVTAKTLVNYVPQNDQVLGGDVRIYRQAVSAGQSVLATLETIQGDADLYVWRPDANQSWVSNREGTLIDEVQFVAPQAGTYQFEVFGYASSEYRLTIEVTAAQGRTEEVTAQAVNKIVRQQPAVSPFNEPEGKLALPVAPQSEISHDLFLPAVQR